MTETEAEAIDEAADRAYDASERPPLDEGACAQIRQRLQRKSAASEGESAA